MCCSCSARAARSCWAAVWIRCSTASRCRFAELMDPSRGSLLCPGAHLRSSPSGWGSWWGPAGGSAGPGSVHSWFQKSCRIWTSQRRLGRAQWCTPSPPPGSSPGNQWWCDRCWSCCFWHPTDNFPSRTPAGLQKQDKFLCSGCQPQST